MKGYLCILFVSMAAAAQAQLPTENFLPPATFGSAQKLIPKLYQRNRGAVLGIQRGQYTFIELGGEAHWRKIGLKKAYVWGATADMEYNFGHNILGYKAGVWTKHGHVNLTYGANLVYYTNFKGGNRYGIGPAVGFRLLGFHFINGYNIMAGSKAVDANTLYVTLRYYFPIDNKFIWDRKDKRKKEKNKKPGIGEKFSGWWHKLKN